MALRFNKTSTNLWQLWRKRYETKTRSQKAELTKRQHDATAANCPRWRSNQGRLKFQDTSARHQRMMLFLARFLFSFTLKLFFQDDSREKIFVHILVRRKASSVKSIPRHFSLNEGDFGRRKYLDSQRKVIDILHFLSFIKPSAWIRDMSFQQSHWSPAHLIMSW